MLCDWLTITLIVGKLNFLWFGLHVFLDCLRGTRLISDLRRGASLASDWLRGTRLASDSLRETRLVGVVRDYVVASHVAPVAPPISSCLARFFVIIVY